MITWFALFLQKVEGANIFPAVILAIWLLYAVFFLVVKANRTKKAIKVAIISGFRRTNRKNKIRMEKNSRRFRNCPFNFSGKRV